MVVAAPEGPVRKWNETLRQRHRDPVEKGAAAVIHPNVF